MKSNRKKNMKTFNQVSQSADYREDSISVSITVCGGSYGGGSETLVLMEKEDETENIHREKIL